VSSTSDKKPVDALDEVSDELLVGGVVGTALLDVGLGVLLGSAMYWLGWTRPPIKDFFVALAGIGGALLVAYAVTAAQMGTVMKDTAKKASDLDASDIPAIYGAFVALVLGVALAAMVGISASLALVRDPPTSADWLLMALFGVSLFTLGVLALVILYGSMIVVFGSD
jgi:hypothetical protein